VYKCWHANVSLPNNTKRLFSILSAETKFKVELFILREPYETKKLAVTIIEYHSITFICGYYILKEQIAILLT
jgi:hypothetical protein